MLVDAAKFLGKVTIKGVESLATWQDKLGIEEGWGKAKDLYNKLVDQVQQEWENKEGYQARMKAAREIQRQVEAYERVFNAEEYHLKRAKDVGYVSAEVLQLIFGGEIIKGVGKGAQVLGKGLRVVEGMEKVKEIVQIGNKLDYVFGKATGSVHNIERSANMLKQLQSIGIFDNEKGRLLFQKHLEEVYNSTKGVLQSNQRVLRESLLMGENGGLGIQSYWEGNKLISVILLGGK